MCSYKRIIILNMICKHVHRTRMLEEVLAVVFHLFAYQGENPKNFLLTVGIIVIKSRINMMMMTFFLSVYIVSPGFSGFISIHLANNECLI